MNKVNETKAFAQIDELIARWRKEITDPAKDKPELVEEGVNLWYKKTGKKPPLILWCDSPIQMILIPVLVANVLKSDSWKTLVARIGKPKNSNSEEYNEKWKAQWIKVEKNTVLPLLERIWNFQYKNESSTTQQTVLDRLSKHLFAILKDGRLNEETLYPKKLKLPQSGVWHSVPHFEIWQRFIKLSARIEQKTSTGFNFNLTNMQGMFLGAIDHRIVTHNIPGVVGDMLKPTEKEKQLLNRIQFIRSKCTEWDRMANTRAALYTEAAQGYMRPHLTPDIDSNLKFHELAWETYVRVKEETEVALKDPRAHATVLWSANASWLPLALSCRLLDPKHLAEFEDEIDSWAYMFHGAAGFIFADDVCFVCRHPKTMVTNDSGQPHCATGAAAKWVDGFDIHAWRGIMVDEALIKRAHEIKIEEILSEKNAELRRIKLDMFGEERFIRESGSTVVDQDQYGTLYKYTFKVQDPLSLDEPLMMVRVRNATRELDGTFKDYYLRVPPNMTTAKEAVAWTFGMSVDDYKPEFQS
ncbi:MAG: hypothetical protein SGJ27_15990 [Candidatus Melainabacteria bacterium]|nr:hypothetical protein [Candidatus Melainabacteria bacterium]